MTQRDGTGREVGGGFRMGNMCIPVVDSCWCMEKTLESPLDCNEIKPVNTKEKQPWIFIWRTDAFELRFWGRLLRVPWTAMRSNQSILKEINPEYSLEGLMLKLKLQYCGRLFGKGPDARKDWGQEGKVWQRIRCLDSITSSMNLNLNKGREIMKDRGGWHAAVQQVVKRQL